MTDQEIQALATELGIAKYQESRILWNLRNVYEAGRRAGLKEAAGYYGNTLLTIGSCDDKGGVSIRPIKDHILDDTGTVRKVLVAATNTDRPVYGTAMMLGQTVMVLEPPTREAAACARN